MQLLAWYTLEKLRRFKLAASPESSKSGSGQSNEDTSNEEYNAASVAGSASAAYRITSPSPQPPPDILSNNLDARQGLFAINHSSLLKRKGPLTPLKLEVRPTFLSARCTKLMRQKG